MLRRARAQGRGQREPGAGHSVSLGDGDDVREVLGFAAQVLPGAAGFKAFCEHEQVLLEDGLRRMP